MPTLQINDPNFPHPKDGSVLVGSLYDDESPYDAVVAHQVGGHKRDLLREAIIVLNRYFDVEAYRPRSLIGI